MAAHQLMDNTTFENFEKQRSSDLWIKGVLIAGILMYAGGVLFGLFRNLQLFEPTFAGVEYAQIGYFAVALLAANAFVLPLFIHKRASGPQYYAALAFYAIEMLIYILNAAVEPRAAQIAQNTQMGFWEWYYWNVAFVAPIIIMAAWGVLFILDSESEMGRAIAEARGELIRNWARKAKTAAALPATNAQVQNKAEGYIGALNQRVLPGNFQYPPFPITNGHQPEETLPN